MLLLIYSEQVSSMWRFILIIVQFGLVQAQTTADRETVYGTVRGHTVPIITRGQQQRELDVFLGIPYAAPPIGDLRWKYTTSPDTWTGVRESFTFGPSCPQDIDILRSFSFGPDYNNMDEDCLYLNIYAPRNKEESPPTTKRAVMVWVHGGAYRYGAGEESPGEQLAQGGDIIVITINYRLGVLAFLSTDDEVSPGNYGLMDVVYALRWVRDNIEGFGGDKERVTLFGNSAGGAAVSTMIFSPQAKDLFHGVVIQSGNALSPWAVYRPEKGSFILPHTVQLAEAHGCPTDNHQAMVDCLRGKDALDLVDTRISGTTIFNNVWAPRVDGTVLTDTPENLLASGDFNKVNVFSGTVPNEVSDEYTGITDIENGWPRSETVSRKLSWSQRFAEQADLVNAALLHEYDLPGDVGTEQRDLYLELRGDDGYAAPHALHAQGHADHVLNTYMYSWEHLSHGAPWPQWMGVPHMEECYYAFGIPLLEEEEEAIPCPWTCTNILWYSRFDWTEQDKQMSRDTMELWSSFAKTGTPSLRGNEWPQYNRDTQFYGRTENGTITMTGLQYYKYSRVNFWNQMLPDLQEASSVTCPPVNKAYTTSAPVCHVVMIMLLPLILMEKL